MRRLRASVDTGNGEPSDLPFEEMPLHSLEQGRRRWQDTGGEDQSWAQPQSNSEEEPMIAVLRDHSAGFNVKRVVILGRGGSGKSTVASKLGKMTGLPVIELDKIFWQPGLQPLPPDEWAKVQRRLIAQDSWIMDGDLGHYDAVEIRLPAADTIILLDFALLRCAWRALRRGLERSDFWRCLIAYRRQSLPVLMQAINRFAPHAELHLIRTPNELQRFLAGLEREGAKRN